LYQVAGGLLTLNAEYKVASPLGTPNPKATAIPFIGTVSGIPIPGGICNEAISSDLGGYKACAPQKQFALA
jgi:hypothetical protein